MGGVRDGRNLPLHSRNRGESTAAGEVKRNKTELKERHWGRKEGGSGETHDHPATPTECEREGEGEGGTKVSIDVSLYLKRPLSVTHISYGFMSNIFSRGQSKRGMRTGKNVPTAVS